LAIKPSESRKRGGDVCKNEMKGPVRMVFLWINCRMFLSTLNTVRKGGRK
jgi:hypothetical protein